MSRKNYDFKAAKSIIETHKEDIKSAEIGMEEDWFWTTEIVFEDGEYVIDLDTVERIAGINGSDWATPVLRLYFNTGEEKDFEVFKEDEA